MTASLQLPLFEPPTTWEPTPVDQLPSWENAKRVAIDIETFDPTLKKLGPGVRRGAFIAGVSFAIEDGPAYYLPMRHLGGGNLPPEKVEEYLKDQSSKFSGDLCGANLQYDLDFLAEVSVEFQSVRFMRDVQLAEPILDELQTSYSLSAIAARYNIPGKDEVLLAQAGQAYSLKDLKADLWKLPARFVAPYGIQDSCLVLQLLRKQERRIDDEELWKVYDLESKLQVVLLRMKRRGVRFSHARLDEVERWSFAEEEKALAQVAGATGVRVALGDVWRADALAPVLKAIGVEVPLTPKTKKPSIKKDVLDDLHHPVVDAILRARKVNKLRTTFVASIREHAIGDRLHCTYNQLRVQKDEDSANLTGAAYGRLSCEHVNLQQQPARDPELGPLWRSIYIPEDGAFWASLDYSQQEPRILTHFAEVTKCRGAWEAAERYRNNPATDNHTMTAQMIHPNWASFDEKSQKLLRTEAKEIFLGRCYGMGDAKLCHQLDLETEWRIDSRSGLMREYAGPEGRAIIDQFNNAVAYVGKLAQKCQNSAEKHGYVRTVGGRKCRFPKGPDGYEWTQKALNRVVQGSSADQMKLAMVQADAAFFPLGLQVHDELGLSLNTPQDVEELSRIMRDAITFTVPMRVVAKCGPSWGEAK